jgi:ABC-2 type transport system ATP-binding protein
VEYGDVYALEIIDVHARYGKRTVLQGVSLQVASGGWFCLLGPNGVGKSTLLQCLAGRVTPTQGAIRIAGHDFTSHADDAKRALGHACAPDQLPGLLTGRQCLDIYAYAKGLRSIDADVLAFAEALRFTPYLDHYVDTFSLGTRQKLCVLLALLGRPRLIVLDEAFNGLDPRSALTLKRELKRRLEDGAAVLLATHSLDIVEHHASHAALMMSGRIVHEWTAAELGELRRTGGDFETALAALREGGD